VVTEGFYVILFREQAHVIAQTEQACEQASRLVLPSEQNVGVRRLLADGFVMRYDPAEVETGLDHGEGVFLACSLPPSRERSVLVGVDYGNSPTPRQQIW